jgi:hypothetical protein
MRKALSPILFTLVITCFFLRWMTIADASAFGGPTPCYYSGEAFARGKDSVRCSGELVRVLVPSPAKAENPEQPFAIGAAAAAAVGLVVSLVRRRLSAVIALLSGVLGTVAMFLLKVSLDQQFAKEMTASMDKEGTIYARYEFGFWLTFSLFIVAAAWGLVSARTYPERTAPVR